MTVNVNKNTNLTATKDSGRVKNKVIPTNVTKVPKESLVNQAAKQKFIEQMQGIKRDLSSCLKLLSQNKLSGQKLGSQSSFKQQLEAIGTRVVSVESHIKRSIIEKSKSEVSDKD